MSLLCAVAIPAYAATITVINTNDSGPGSLRQAVGSAQNGDTIVFDLELPATILLTSDQARIYWRCQERQMPQRSAFSISCPTTR